VAAPGSSAVLTVKWTSSTGTFSASYRVTVGGATPQ
jgi:hypothetical protein